MPILAVGRVIGEHDTLTWRIVTHYVNAARAKADQAGITRVGIDETASRRGQKYVSLFVDLPERKVVFVTPGKDASTVAAFAADLQVHGGDPAAVTEVSVDMSKAFAKGIAASLFVFACRDILSNGPGGTFHRLAVTSRPASNFTCARPCPKGAACRTSAFIRRTPGENSVFSMSNSASAGNCPLWQWGQR
jgi:hypothetical protein